MSQQGLFCQDGWCYPAIINLDLLRSIYRSDRSEEDQPKIQRISA